MDIKLQQAGALKFQLFFKPFKNDFVFTFSLLLAIASCFFLQPKLSYIDFKVLVCLFNLMVVIKAFEELRLLDMFAVAIINRCTDTRKVSLVMIILTFFSSMFITNDIALLTLVPLSLIISKKSGTNMLVTIILQTLAANIGSSLTPMGNPQNLYIFSYYKLYPLEFFAPVALFSFLGLMWLIVLNLFIKKTGLKANLENTGTDLRKAAVWAVLFIIIVLSVFNVINYYITLIITIAVTVMLNRRLLKKADYQLLTTFVCFFIFIGNISSIPAIAGIMSKYVDNPDATYFASIVMSQGISNVPCAVLLSKFTGHWRELLLGVNIGGMGTIIASLASLISYKLFISEHPEKSVGYLNKFSLYNFVSLALFTVINYFIRI